MSLGHNHGLAWPRHAPPLLDPTPSCPQAYLHALCEPLNQLIDLLLPVVVPELCQLVSYRVKVGLEVARVELPQDQVSTGLDSRELLLGVLSPEVLLLLCKLVELPHAFEIAFKELQVDDLPAHIHNASPNRSSNIDDFSRHCSSEVYDLSTDELQASDEHLPETCSRTISRLRHFDSAAPR